MSALLLDVSLQRPWAHLGAIDHALRVDSHTLRSARARRTRRLGRRLRALRARLERIRDEVLHRAVFRAADAHATQPLGAFATDRLRLGVRHVDVVLRVDEDSARTAE